MFFHLFLLALIEWFITQNGKTGEMLLLYLCGTSVGQEDKVDEGMQE